MLFSFQEPIWFYPTPIDFRKQIDGLMQLVASQLEKDPSTGQLFLFRNRRSDKIKMLCYERNGFWLFYKRIERGRFQFPAIDDEVMSLNGDEFSWLLSGLDFTQHCGLPTVKATRFY